MKNKTLKLVYLLLVLVPVGSGLLYALLFSSGLVGVLNTGWTTAAWQKVLFSGTFWGSMGYSFYIAVLSLFLAVCIALTLALSWQKALHKGLLSAAIYLPLCFPATVMAFFSFQLLSKSGVWSRWAYQLGWISDLQNFPTLIKDAYGIGIIFTSVLLITPFFTILFSQLYQTEKLSELISLSKTLGAGNKKILRSVVVPVLLRRSAVSLMLFLVFVMGSYEVPLLLGRQNPQMISVVVIQKIQRFNLYDMPQGYAMAALYVLLILGVLWMLRKRFSDFLNH